MEAEFTRQDLVELVDFISGIGAAVTSIGWAMIAALIFINPKAAIAFAVVDYFGSVAALQFIRRKLRDTRLCS